MHACTPIGDSRVTWQNRPVCARPASGLAACAMAELHRGMSLEREGDAAWSAAADAEDALQARARCRRSRAPAACALRSAAACRAARAAIAGAARGASPAPCVG